MKPRKEIHELSRDLSNRAEAFCKRFFPDGQKQGNYWQIGDTTGAKGQSLVVRLKDHGGRKAGNWNDYATGEWGDLIDLLHLHRGNGRKGDTLREVRLFLGETPLQKTAADDNNTLQSPAIVANQRISQGRKLFNIGKPLLGTRGDSYLSNRGIDRRGPALRFHPTVFLRGPGNSTEKHPALLAKITDNEGRTTGCARTFLDAGTGKLASIENPKRVLGQLHGNAIRFGAGPYRQELIVGEGLENVLSVGSALQEYDLASCLTANHMALFVVPTNIKRVWIARDRDDAGLQASKRLRDRLEGDGVFCGDLVPKLKDFNLDICTIGKDALRRRLLLAMKEQAPMSISDSALSSCGSS